MHVGNDGSFQVLWTYQRSRGLEYINRSPLYLKHTRSTQHLHLKPSLDVFAIIH